MKRTLEEIRAFFLYPENALVGMALKGKLGWRPFVTQLLQSSL